MAAAPLLTNAQSTRLTLRSEWRVSAEMADLLPIGASDGQLSVSKSGIVAVGQSDDHQILFYDPSGKALGRYGREGAGPGEFTRIFALGWIGDTLWVLTGSLGAGQNLVLIGPDLGFLRQERTPVGLQGTTLRGFPPITQAILPDGDLMMMVLPRGGSASSWPGAPEGAVSVVLRVASDGKVRQRIGWRASGNCHVHRPDGQRFPIPYCKDPPMAVAPDGNGAAFANTIDEDGATVRCRIVRVDADGDTIYTSTMSVEPAMISREQMDRQIQLLTGGNRELVDLLHDASLPKRFPPARSMVMGRDGTLAIELGTQATRHEWSLLDAHGVALGTFLVSANVRVRAITRDRVWATVEDRDGLEDIVQYRVSP